MRPFKILWPALLLVAPSFLTLAADTARACGPFFPSSALDGGDKALLEAPIADFEAEMAHFFPKTTLVAAPPKSTQEYTFPTVESQTDAADVAEILDATNNKALASQVEAWRKELRKTDATGKFSGNPGPLPAGLSPEFAYYEQGALLYHMGDLPAARAQWQKILDLPERNRQHRTLWAHYMIGRSLIDSDPAKAAVTLAQVRRLARPQGPYADPLGLAVPSLGWEAQALWKQKQFRRAIDLYMEQAAAGDSSGIWSIRDCAAGLLASDQNLQQAAKDPVLQSIVTAYLISNGGPYNNRGGTREHARRTPDWLEMLREFEVKDMPGSDRLAWAAYRNGDFTSAQHWLTLGGKHGRDTPIGQWIQAKLYLRSGDVEKAAACLASAARSFPVEENWTNKIDDGDDSWRPAWHAAGELAALKLGRGQYTDSLDLLFMNHYWWDAAYVAERVLTVDEFKAYVDTHWPHPSPPQPAPTDVERFELSMRSWSLAFKDTPAGSPVAALRSLLRGRLTRVGRWKEARAYFTPDNQNLLDTYVAGIRAGHDAKRSDAERARALFAAARIGRAHGMELLATECGPDEARVDGAFEIGILADDRTRQRDQGNERFAAALADEIKRARAAAPDPEKRFHYRYVAADLAWDAARLLPDNSDELAEMLVETGGWLKDRDPKAADRFYKALVTRCGKTALGRQAEEERWFPR